MSNFLCIDFITFFICMVGGQSLGANRAVSIFVSDSFWDNYYVGAVGVRSGDIVSAASAVPLSLERNPWRRRSPASLLPEKNALIPPTKVANESNSFGDGALVSVAVVS
jgi:hypothetical protein